MVGRSGVEKDEVRGRGDACLVLLPRCAITAQPPAPRCHAPWSGACCSPDLLLPCAACSSACTHLLEEVRGLHVDTHGRKHNGKGLALALVRAVLHQACNGERGPAVQRGVGGRKRTAAAAYVQASSQPGLIAHVPPCRAARASRTHLLAGRSAQRCRCAAGRRQRTAGSSGRARWSSSRQWWRCRSAAGQTGLARCWEVAWRGVECTSLRRLLKHVATCRTPLQHATQAG